jgi:hypothetical protein
MKKVNKPEPINLAGVTAEDLIQISDSDGKIKNVLDLKRIKNQLGASFCQIIDEKLGLQIACQSFKESSLDLANLSLALFSEVKNKRGLIEMGVSYIG